MILLLSCSAIWDVSDATSFSGGSGTESDPYQISSYSQLILMKEYSDKYFILTDNIDLNDINWVPFEFKGDFDGNGKIISNLKVEGNQKNVGFFSSLSGNVYDVTFQDCKVNSDSGCVGIVAGSANGASLSGINIILNEDSYVSGSEIVGGFVGSADGSLSITDSSISGELSQISGISYIGGAVGFSNNLGKTVVNNTHIDINIEGKERSIGGIIGLLESDGSLVENSSFAGNITGSYNVGGISGEIANSTISSSKAIVVFKKSSNSGSLSANSRFGGIVGYGVSGNVIACYTDGSMPADLSKCGGIAGEFMGHIELCYSTMESDNSSFNGIGGTYLKDCATTTSNNVNGDNCVSNCKNVTQFIKETDSQYLSEYNLLDNWFTDGNVSCPRLAWE